MSEYAFLLTLALFLYLLECAVWVPADSYAFRLFPSRRSPARLISNVHVDAGPSVKFSFPLSLRGGISICAPIPFAISPLGIALSRPPSSNKKLISVEHISGVFIPYEEIHSLTHSQKTLLINELSVATNSETQALYLEGLLGRLRKCRPQNRPAEIERALAAQMNISHVLSRLKHYRKETTGVALGSAAFMIAIFCVSPPLVWKWGITAVWPLIVGILILCAAGIAGEFYSAHISLFPDAREKRWTSIAMILLSPPSALHASKFLARDLLIRFHPVAVAAAEGPKENFRKLISWMLRDLTFGLHQTVDMDRQVAEAINWHRGQVRRLLTDLAKELGEDPTSLVAPPPAESPRVRTYCPRCWSQYVLADGFCSDCEGVELASYESSPRSSNRAPAQTNSAES